MNLDQEAYESLKADHTRLLAENERLQAANGQLLAKAAALEAEIQDAQIETRNLQGDLVDTTGELEQTRRALDEARRSCRPDIGRTTVLAPLFAQPSVMSRRDWYILAVETGLNSYRDTKQNIAHADALLAAADKGGDK